MAICLLSMRLIHIVTILSHRMIEDSGKRGNTMAERRQLFAEMSKYRTFKEHPAVSMNTYGKARHNHLNLMAFLIYLKS